MILLPPIIGMTAFFCIDYALGWGWLGWCFGMAACLAITIPLFKWAVERWDRLP